jgi:hypothetical protein
MDDQELADALAGLAGRSHGRWKYLREVSQIAPSVRQGLIDLWKTHQTRDSKRVTDREISEALEAVTRGDPDAILDDPDPTGGA